MNHELFTEWYDIMELVRHHTDEGQYMALVVKTGIKWTHVLYMCSPRLSRIPNTESKYFTSFGEASMKQIKQFRASARSAGYVKRKNIV